MVEIGCAEFGLRRREMIFRSNAKVGKMSSTGHPKLVKFNGSKGSLMILPTFGGQSGEGDQLRLEASPTRRAMTMAGNRMPRVDKKVASILAEVLTA